MRNSGNAYLNMGAALVTAFALFCMALFSAAAWHLGVREPRNRQAVSGAGRPRPTSGEPAMVAVPGGQRPR